MPEAASAVSPEAAAAAAAANTNANAGGSGAQSGSDAGGQAAATDGGASANASAKPAGAPDKYTDFTLPQGVTLTAEQSTEFSTYAKSLNLTQEQAQTLLNRELKTRGDTEASVLARQQDHVKQLATDWKTQATADKEFGGEALQTNLATAVKARDAFASPEFVKMLNDSGLGNHPEVIRFFFRVGKSMSEDKHVQGGQAAAANTEQARLKRMYPSMFQQ